MKWREVMLYLSKTVRALAPVDDFRLVDPETGVGGGGEAGCVADSTIDVHGFSAGAADEMVVIVTDPGFVKRGGSGWLDAADEALLRQDPDTIVNSLPGNGADLGADVLGQCIRRDVWPARHGAQHRKALGGHGDTVFAEEIG